MLLEVTSYFSRIGYLSVELDDIVLFSEGSYRIQSLLNAINNDIKMFSIRSFPYKFKMFPHQFSVLS